jgi:hypothetical protein
MAHLRLVEAQIDRKINLTQHDYGMLLALLDELRCNHTQDANVRKEALRIANKVRQSTQQGWGKS